MSHSESAVRTFGAFLFMVSMASFAAASYFPHTADAFLDWVEHKNTSDVFDHGGVGLGLAVIGILGLHLFFKTKV